MRRIFLLIPFLALGGCSYLPEGDPNYRDATTHDMRTGGTYTPSPRQRQNTSDFFQVIGDLITGKRKSTW